MRHPSLASCLLAAVFLLTFLAGPGEAAEKEVIPLWFRADIVIDADGSVSGLDWRNYKPMPEAALSGLERLVSSWRFQPGSLDGAPAEIETTLFVRMLASEQEGGAFGLSIADAFIGPSAGKEFDPDQKPVPVFITATSLRSAELVFDATFPPQGAATFEIVEYGASTSNRTYQAETEQRARDGFARWQIRPERVGGETVTARFRYLYDRCMDRAWCERNETPSMAGLPEMPRLQATPLDSVTKLLTDVTAGSD